MKLHLGCGAIILEGWINVDIDPPKGGFKQDLRRPLPQGHDEVDFIFHEHFLEHLTLDEGMVFLRDCYRVLKPGGVMRVVTPDLMHLARSYVRGDLLQIPGVWEPRGLARMMNEAMRLWGHQFVYDQHELFSTMREAGFHSVNVRQYKSSQHEALNGIDQRPHYGELIMEGTK